MWVLCNAKILKNKQIKLCQTKQRVEMLRMIKVGRRPVPSDEGGTAPLLVLAWGLT